jgi:ADP-heptose:LPS heptosyltransferase
MTPVLAVAKRKPGTVVGVVCETPFDEVLEGNPDVDVLINAPRRKAWRSRVTAIREVRDFRPDMVIDLHGGTTSALITGLSGAPRRIGYSSARNSFAYSEVTPDTRKVWGRERIHTVEHQLAPLKHLGFPVEPIPPLRVPLSRSDVRFVKGLLTQGGSVVAGQIESSVSSRSSDLQLRASGDPADLDRPEGLRVDCGSEIPFPFVLVHPAAAFDTKQWPVENFSELIQKLREDGLRVVVTCGPGEAHNLDRISELVDEGVTFVPPLPLSKFVALASLCKVYVGNDTGTTHIAAALKQPIVVVFGSSDSTVWYPWDVDFELVKSDLPCIPCPGYTCSEYEEPLCIQSVPVDQIFEAVKKLMQ